MQDAEQFLPLNSQNSTIANCGSGCRVQGLVRRDSSLAQEIAGTEQRHCCFLALFGQSSEPHPPLLDMPNLCLIGHPPEL
jgi:hypothetical protein